MRCNSELLHSSGLAQFLQTRTFVFNRMNMVIKKLQKLHGPNSVLNGSNVSTGCEKNKKKLWREH